MSAKQKNTANFGKKKRQLILPKGKQTANVDKRERHRKYQEKKTDSKC